MDSHAWEPHATDAPKSVIGIHGFINFSFNIYKDPT